MSDAAVEQAIQGVSGGNPDDFRVVVAAYHQRLRAALAGLCPPSVDPDEIAHLAFIEAYRNLERYRAGSNFFAWLCAIARHRLLAESKHIQRLASHQQNYLDQLLVERVIGLAEGESEITDIRLGWLRECIAQLKPGVQALLEQRYGRCEAIEGMARALGRIASALRVPLFSVREKLREFLEQKRRASLASG